MNTWTGYIGTYDSPRSFGVYQFTLDAETGALSVPQLFYPAKNAKCTALWNGCLAITAERGGRAGVCLLDTQQSPAALRGELFCETQPACFIAQTENRIYTANYHEGTVLIYRKDDSALHLIKRIVIAPKAGCHQVLIHEHLLLVPCLELDEIRLYDCNKEFAPAGKICLPPGSGPRHGSFDRLHRHLFIVSERSNQLFSYRVTADAEFILTQTDTIVPPDAPRSASAAIRLSPDERFLYISVRGADRIAVFRLNEGSPALLQHASCGGSHPRDFLIEPGGNYLLVVNRGSNDLISFRRNQATGRLGEIHAKVPVPEGIGIALEHI